MSPTGVAETGGGGGYMWGSNSLASCRFETDKVPHATDHRLDMIGGQIKGAGYLQ